MPGITVAVVAPAANILGSWVEAVRVLPLEVVQVYPARWHVRGEAAGGFHTSTDMTELRDADILVTDCWPADADAAALEDHRITAAVLDRADRDLSFLPCPPVTRGREVSEDAMRHARCRAIEAKASLLHAQNAALEWVFGAI